MHTPAHVVLNLTVLGKHGYAKYFMPVLLGSLIPDVPMFIFYFVERFAFETPSHIIWREAYFEAGWQNFIDMFNSIPLTLLALVVVWRLKSQFYIFLCLSMFLHFAFDLPFHHDDGHRHFYPFSDWRFESPISYWDPGYFGRIVSVIEGLAVMTACWILYLRHQQMLTRTCLASVAILQVFDLAFKSKFYL